MAPLQGNVRLTVAANQWLRVRVQISGGAPTTIRMRAWLDGSSEPSTWQYTGVDVALTTLQTPGVIGLCATQSGTNTPITMRFDDLSITHLRDTQTRTIVYGYDGLQRLTSAVESGSRPTATPIPTTHAAIA